MLGKCAGFAQSRRGARNCGAPAVGVVEYMVTDPLFQDEARSHDAPRDLPVSDKMEHTIEAFCSVERWQNHWVFGDVRQAVKAKYAALESVLIQAGK